MEENMEELNFLKEELKNFDYHIIHLQCLKHIVDNLEQISHTLVTICDQLREIKPTLNKLSTKDLG